MRSLVVAVLLLAASAADAGDGLDVAMGGALFDRLWVPAPSSTLASDGLGPRFNARSCAACHSRGGAARFTPPSSGDADTDGLMDGVISQGLVARLALDDGSPHPVFGRQLQPASVPGLAPEVLDRDEPDLRLSHRQAPTLRGRGLMAALDAAGILAVADPDDADGDGISGRPRLVDGAIGRFGWKAEHATLEGQIATAFALDLGLSTPLLPDGFGDCAARDAACWAMPDGGRDAFSETEISAEMLRLVVAFTESLHPAPAGVDAVGSSLFAATGCAACHVPDMPGPDGPLRVHSDLLLHDMGPGLDDGLPEPGALSSEWRTAPLIDMAPAPGRRYLHDGRAADVTQAVAAHGGEAGAARDRFAALPAADRAALAAYVEGL